MEKKLLGVTVSRMTLLDTTFYKINLIVDNIAHSDKIALIAVPTKHVVLRSSRRRISMILNSAVEAEKS